jgi:methanogenic corrinoid protein MtbC1
METTVCHAPGASSDGWPDCRALTDRYLSALLAGDRSTAGAMILDAVDAGLGVDRVYLEVFQPALYEIGRRWERNEIGVAEEHFCTAATQLVMSQLYPRIFAAERRGGTFLGASVEGELHEIGIRMVCDFFEMHGWDTYYVGSSTPVDAVARIVVDRQPQIVGLSATITPHVGRVEAVIRRLRDLAGNDRRPIMVGGRPFNEDAALWREVGADGCARNAADAVELARQWTGES